MVVNLRRMLLGKPLATHALEHETLGKILALPIFSSDALSSVAYATQEMMIALTVVGAVAFKLCIWEASAIVLLLVVLTASYNQTIFAYPQGGGAYNVAHDNLGILPAQIAAVSLMTDYILTVAVSAASGIDAIVSAAPVLQKFDVVLCVLAVWFIAVMNQRGVTESARAFAMPVYIFIGSMLTLIVLGLWQMGTVGHFASANRVVTPDNLKTLYHREGQIGLFLILHSFASGCTALTGLEAISNSTGAFRAPKSRNAAVTMWWLAFFLGTMLLGITWLAQHVPYIVPTDSGETVISQVAHVILGYNSWFYWCVQISTFAVLILAANTSFTGFPRLGAMVAADGFLPRQLLGLGDRLVFSNGITILALVASVLLVIFRGSVDRLIPLYAIGVYMAFTLSQSGMVVRWCRLKTSGWRLRASMNFIGAAITAVVAVVFGVVKFTSGAWVVLILIPTFTLLLHRIGKHYAFVRSRLRIEGPLPREAVRKHIALVPAPDLSEAVLSAIEYARIITPNVVLLQWQHGSKASPGVALDDLGMAFRLDHQSLSWVAAIVKEVRHIRDEEDALVTLVLPENIPGAGSWGRLLGGTNDLVLKIALLNEHRVVVSDTRRFLHAPGLSPQHGLGTMSKLPHTALVLVPSVHRGTLEAVAYARRISKDVRALSIEVNATTTPRLRQQWNDFVPDVPLMVMESPYRQLRDPLIRYIRALRVHKPGSIITVVTRSCITRQVFF
jgi:amino acid transporter